MHKEGGGDRQRGDAPRLHDRGVWRGEAALEPETENHQVRGAYGHGTGSTPHAINYISGTIVNLICEYN